MNRKNFLWLIAVLQLFCSGLISPYEASATNTSIYDSQFTCGTSGTVSQGNDDNSEGSGNLDAEIEQNIKDIYAYMHDKFGFSAEAIAGILGNWRVESGIQPYAVEGDFLVGRSIEHAKASTGGSMGIGYGQWTAGRHTSLVNWANDKHKGDWWTTEAQLDFMFHGDGGFVAILKTYALTATDDILQNTVLFHNTWEISADSAEAVIANRGGATKDVYAFMKAQGMTGKKDENKINTIAGNASGGNDNSSSNASGTTEDVCATEDTGSGGGSLGQSTKPNGKHAQITKVMSYEDALSEYGSVITLPKFDVSSFDWATSPFGIVDGIDLRGQCTELTWVYMSKLYDGKQPTMGNGGYVWGSYKDAGAEITKNPTVGYGFSALSGYIGASGSAGHTGIVLAVFEDGSFLTANFNFPPHSAPERYITVAMIDGVDGSDNVHFFSGIGNPTISENK